MAPTGWRKQNGLYINEGVEQDPDAQERGGAFYLNLKNKTLDIYPWQDGSTDRISMRPVLPDGVTFTGPLTETNWGWKAPMSNGWSVWLVDMQLAKIPEALDGYLPQGLALVYGGIPIAEVQAHAGGEWRPKKVKFTAPNLSDYVAIIPRALTQEEIDAGNIRPKCVTGGISIGHRTKCHNIDHRKYMNGNIAFAPPPLVVGWLNGQITGWHFGTYEDLGGGEFDKVFNVNAQFNIDLTRRGIGDPVTLSVSLEIGYSTVAGTTDGGLGDHGSYSTINEYPATVGDTYNVDSIHWWSASSLGAFSANVKLGLHDKISATQYDYIADTVCNVGVVTEAGGGKWVVGTPAAGNPTVGVGNNILITAEFINGVTANRFGYNWEHLGGYPYGTNGRFFNSSGQGWADQDVTAGSTGVGYGAEGIRYAAYATLSSLTSPPTTTNATVDPASVSVGTNSALSADITDTAHTITAAEYFIGTDPGEGSGTAMSLGAGTTSREATATIDTSALAESVHTVSVRGFDATDGWGAVDTAELTVTAATGPGPRQPARLIGRAIGFKIGGKL